MIHRNQVPTRRGVATVEAALSLPVLVAIVLGGVQASDTIHLKHVATLAAYEGTLVVAKGDATRSDVLDAATAMLRALEMQGGQVQMSPDVARLSDLNPGDQVSVTVTLPVLTNLSGPQFFTSVREVRAVGVTAR